MKTLKQISDEKYKEYYDLLLKAREKSANYKIKVGFKGLSLDDKINVCRKTHKFFDPVHLSEKKYIKAKLNYVNSAEYKETKYQKDKEKFKTDLIKVRFSLNNLREFVNNRGVKTKPRDFIYLGTKKNYALGWYKEITKFLNDLEQAYQKSPGSYNLAEVTALYSSENTFRKYIGKRVRV